jgi:phosphoglycerate kinase
VLETLLQKVDQLIVGGGIANTFLAAKGIEVGKSLYEKDFIPQAKKLLARASELGVEIPLPTDVVVADSFSEKSHAQVKQSQELVAEDRILDIGPQTSKQFTHLIHKARMILWNGPVGVFEWEKFAKGTQAIAEAIAKSGAFSVAGGGDTIAAIEKFNVEKNISYISTGGGAFLEFIEGKKLPAIEVLEQYETH